MLFAGIVLIGRSMRKEKTRILPCVVFGAVTACLGVVSGSGAYADGKFYPERAYKKPPAIPSQRAILVYRDGVEKLTIESALEGQGHSFGWVIPLPSKPTKFEKVSPGLLKTLSLAVQPELTHDLTTMLDWLTLAGVILSLSYLFVLVRKPKGFAGYCFIVLGVVSVAIALMPTLQKTGHRDAGFASEAVGGVKIHDVQKIGNYELAVLDAETADALGLWLDRNGFSTLTEGERVVISDYIKEKWCFVAAKLSRDGSGYSRPHPLAMSFPCNKPVYPIRLTATGGGKVYVELFVIADNQAKSKQLALEVSDCYSHYEIDRKPTFEEVHWRGFKGRAFHQEIFHPKAIEEMWEGCILSKLCGALDLNRIDEDIVLDFTGTKSYRKHYYSRSGASEMGLGICLGVWCVAPLVLAGLFWGRIRSKGGRLFYVTRVIAPSAVCSILIWVGTFLALPKVQVTTNNIPARWEFRYRMLETYMAMHELALENDFFQEMNLDEVVEVIDDFVACQIWRNPHTLEKTEHEDSPGNYTVFEDKRGVVFRVFGRRGDWDDFLLSSPPDKLSKDEAGRLFMKLVSFAQTESEWDVGEALVGVTRRYDKAHKEFVRVPARFDRRDDKLFLLLAKLYVRQPPKLVPAILADVKMRLSELAEHQPEIEYELSMLGCMTHTVPPMALTDEKRVSEFLLNVQGWVRDHGSE
jgi:hypothetical protein